METLKIAFWISNIDIASFLFCTLDQVFDSDTYEHSPAY
jgi:hypothetical protein